MQLEGGGNRAAPQQGIFGRSGFRLVVKPLLQVVAGSIRILLELMIF